jgi:tetratricopeptide (TPR) repeat protein
MESDSESFGDLLRRFRESRSMSLTDLANKINFSKGYLSRIETGGRRGNQTVAAICDRALDTGGALARHLQAAHQGRRGYRVPRPRRPEYEPGSVALNAADLDTAEGLFEHLRGMGRTTNSRLVLPGLVAYTRTLIDGVPVRGPVVRRRHLLLVARYAEFVGWMLQEAGATEQALRWTDRAVEFAAAADDRAMAAHAQVRRALFAMYRNDPTQTVDLAGAAVRAAGPWPRIHRAAWQRLAQGHALAGRAGPAEEALARAAALVVDEPTAPPPALVLGPAGPADSVTLTTAWCYTELGRWEEAAEMLCSALPRFPDASRRSRARYGVRAAYAQAMSGDPGVACQTLRSVLVDVVAVRSATVGQDLARLKSVLRRFPRHPDVIETAQPLARAIRESRAGAEGS